jgi:excinuclease ABC subunit C
METKTDTTSQSIDNLARKLSGVSSEPGVYLMKDDRGEVLYVGKASNLRKRLASYFSKTGHPNIKTWALLKKIDTFETIITASEKEALILESNLIKHHRPRYNVDLKDDKRFLSLRLDMKEAYPNLTLVRKIQKDGALYFGPFSSAQALRQTQKFIRRTFRLRNCSQRNFKSRTRPCLQYQMGWCLGPCCLEVDGKVYGEIVKEVVLFLKGRAPELVRKIKHEMMSAAELQDFERAALLRDKMFALEKTLETQVAVTTDFKDRDVIGLAGSPNLSVLTLLSVRNGFLLDTRHFNIRETMSTGKEMVRAFIRQYYEKAPFIPEEILVPMDIDDAAILEEELESLKGNNVAIRRPHRGEKRRLIHLAIQNAENELKELKASLEARTDLLLRLQNRLKTDRMPVRIECFDNSNISGTAPVAGMVVFENAKPMPSAYRHYKIKTVAGPDDYASMAEILKRRYGKGEASKPYPDLLMVDGGKGQLNIARSILREMGLADEFSVIGIAKKDETRGETADKIYQPGRSNPTGFGREGDLLLFLQRIRDEAHRFAIGFHRRRRAKTTMGSALDHIPGIGEKRKKTLLKHFRSVKKIRAATLIELSALPGMNRKAAEAVISHISSD